MRYSIETIKSLTYDGLRPFCDQIRALLIDNFSEHGGHVGSNLGTVELIVSMLKEFDYHRDYIISDTGHQSYLMKLLTERPNVFASIRKTGGLSGFADKYENPRDHYISGHGGSGVSACVSLVEALKRRPDASRVICLVGDAAMAEGLALEALNNLTAAGHSRLILVLNDNGWSIERNLGNLSRIFGSAQTSESLFNLLGFGYVHCADGHDLHALAAAWEEVHRLDGHTVIHVRTVKGRGLPVAEADTRRRLHYTDPFDPATGQKRQTFEGLIRFVDVNAAALCDLRREDERVVAITPAMCGGNGLDVFQDEFPESFFDAGMCEQYALASANGHAIAGNIPVVALHAAFLPRAFDQVFQDICLQNIHAVLLIGRSGFAGPDGPTHHGVFDLSYLRCLPNLTMISPRDGNDYYRAIRDSVEKAKGPVAILTPHAYTVFSPELRNQSLPPPAAIEHVSAGEDLLILCTGVTYSEAMSLRDKLSDKGQSVGVAHIRQVKPLDKALLRHLVTSYKEVLVLEENTAIGGLGSELALWMKQEDLGLPLKHFAVGDCFYPHGDIPSLREMSGISHAKVFEKVVFGI
jgi:1-deoxy-D-xylulose-5-phosphate synthase